MLRYVPALLCTAAILFASSDLFSAYHTGGLLRTVLGHVTPASWIEPLNHVLRKTGHVLAYGLHGFLWMRAIRHDTTWKRAAIAAVLVTFIVASIDEAHQSFLPSRGGSPFDVLLDTSGAALAVLLFRR